MTPCRQPHLVIGVAGALAASDLLRRIKLPATGLRGAAMPPALRPGRARLAAWPGPRLEP